MTWTPWALPGILAGLFAGSAAVVLLRTAPDRSLNRRLAVVLSLEALWMSGSVFFFVESATVFMWIAAVAVAAMTALPFQYLSFLAASVDTPLVAPCRSRTAFWVLAALSATAAAALLSFPRVFLGELYSPPWATWNFEFTAWGTRLNLVHAGASVFGLIVSLTAFLRARPGSVARDRARWFAMAFGIRDVVAASLYLLYPVLRPVPFWGDFAYNQANAFANVFYVGLMAYGVLRVQLFDLDLKLKVAIRQSTVGAIIAAAFFTGSELLEGLIPVQGTVLGLLSAGVIVILIRPVQGFAEGLASQVMKGVEDTPEYLDRQKHRVYRAALEGALEDGRISERERSILARVREQLDISPETASRLEEALR